MGRKLIALNFKASTELPALDELKAFLATDFGRRVEGFTTLETDAKWGELTLDLVGKDGAGRLIAVFPSVSVQERAFHEVLAQALVGGTWLEENQDEVTRLYGERGVKADEPLRVILVAPRAVSPSRALARALERAGIEVMPYTIYEIETGGDSVFAVSFDTATAPAAVSAPSPPSRPAAAARPERREPPAPELRQAEPAPVETRAEEAAPEPPRAERAPEPAWPPKPPSPVEVFIGSLADPNIKAMSQQIFTFLLRRFPAADGVVSPQDRGFTLTVGAEHLATIRLDRGALWLEVGPERIPTNKIKDPATLERAMNLPSVLDALGSVHSR
jgi:hypothetical protein